MFVKENKGLGEKKIGEIWVGMKGEMEVLVGEGLGGQLDVSK